MFKAFRSIALNTPFFKPNVYFYHSPHLYTKHLAELNMRAVRRNFLNRAVLNQAKDIIHAEVRKPSDYVLKLKQQGKCPGVIIPHSGDKAAQIDVVLPGKAMKTRFQNFQYPLQRVWVRVEGRDHMCVLSKVRFNIKNFIQMVVFKEYVPGKPNVLTIPVTLSHLQENRFFHAGCQFNNPIQRVEIICYNNEYPTCFYVDVSQVNYDRPYRVGDLSNTFPPGIILSPNNDVNKLIFEVVIPEGYADNNEEIDMEKVMANVNYGLEKKQKPAATGAAGTAAGGATPAAAGGKAAAAAPASGKKK